MYRYLNHSISHPIICRTMDSLQIGKTVVDDEPMIGFKYLINCVSIPSPLDVLKKGQGMTSFARCFTKITTQKDSTIISPESCGNCLRLDGETLIPSDDLRIDNYTTGEIMTFDGKLCYEARSPVYDMIWLTSHTQITRVG